MRKMTMEERIQAFYRQSGGPNNPEIDRILKQHLMHGKDHGIKGKIETVEDAIRDAFTDDKSTALIVDWLAEKKIERLSRRYQEEDKYLQLGEQIRQGFESISNERLVDLEKELFLLSEKVKELVKLVDERIAKF